MAIVGVIADHDGGTLFCECHAVESDGGKIFRWSENAWTELPDQGFRTVSVGKRGEVWATKGDDGKIFHLR